LEAALDISETGCGEMKVINPAHGEVYIDEFMKLRHFIVIGSSGDFGGEMVWFNVASK